MHSYGFFPKLAAQNIGRSRRFYLPYILTGIGTVAMFYIMCYLTADEYLKTMPGADAVRTIMVMGTVVVGLFASIFLFYTNSFLMKRRKKELGLYNILGMEKRHIARLMFFETVFIALLCLVLGLIGGILLSKLMLLLLIKLLRFQVKMGFSVSVAGLAVTGAVFLAIFFLTLLSNLLRIRLSKPIELLHGGNVGEREPKTKWLLTLIGLLTLGAGYTIAIMTKSPLQALALFFVAVVLVIIGTYCLFTAGSIAALKLLRKNKDYYYQAKHFTAVSGMLYRMKRNAVGLGNICILATMVLVTVSSTVCLYLGAEDSLRELYPQDVSISLLSGENDKITAELLSAVSDRAQKSGLTTSNLSDFSFYSYSPLKVGNNFGYIGDSYPSGGETVNMTVLTAEEYGQLTGRTPDLSPDQVWLWCSNEENDLESLTLLGQPFTVEGRLDDFPFQGSMLSAVDAYGLVVADDAAFIGLFEGGVPPQRQWKCGFDLSGADEEKLALYKTLSADVGGICGKYNDQGLDIYYSIDCRQAMSEEFYSLYGGFLFLGLFLGTLFLMAAVLIIYYKQISEGYDDKERFEIMQKVGMSAQEVRGTIKSQILTVFFLPLAAAVVHIAAAFKMITRLLTVFNLTNVGLFALCCLGTVCVFALVYAAIYALTARTYYQIVRA